MKQFRQGDVLLVEISEFDEVFMPVANKTLALGEATGHHHTFDGDVIVLENPGESSMSINDKGMLVEVRGESAVLTHQEHAPITIPKGKYKRIIQRQYTPAGIINVSD